MSLCVRSLPGKLSSLVSGRKSLSKFDQYHLYVSSFFLKQFLGTQRALSIKTNTESKPLLPFVDYTLHPNLSPASLDTCNQWNEKLCRQYGNKSMAMYWTQGLCRQHYKLQKVALSRNKKHLAAIKSLSNNIFRVQYVEDNKTTLSLNNSRIISSGSLNNSRKSNFDGILLTFNTSILKTNSQSSSLQNEEKPTQEKLQYIVNCLSNNLTNLFVKPQDYAIYTKDLIFINNIRGVTTVGLGNYAKQLIFLRMIGHLKFAHVKLDIIKITMHPEDATVKVRWRIRGITSLKMFALFWKYKILKIQESIDKNQELWYDGFSTYYVNGDGKIYKHIADKVMPDQDAKKEDLRIAAKLALFSFLGNIYDDKNLKIEF